MKNSQRLNLYNIDMKYVRNLANADDNVMSVSPQISKQKRPFVGVLILINQKKYCIPLSSPKEKFRNKKNSADFIKILHSSEKNENGALKTIGVLNLNNMLPIDECVISKIDLKVYASDNGQTRQYKKLMQDQLDWCRSNEDMILRKANKLYDIITNYPEKNINLTKRCCNFKKLEIVLDNYIKNMNTKSQNQPTQQSSNTEKKQFLGKNPVLKTAEYQRKHQEPSVSSVNRDSIRKKKNHLE